MLDIQLIKVYVMILNRCSMWTSKPSELHDGPSSRDPHALRAHHEPEGRLRALREAPSPRHQNEGALPSGPRFRNEDEKTWPQSRLPWSRRPSRSCPSQVHRQQRLWLWRNLVCRHGNRTQGQPSYEYSPELHAIWVDGG